MAHPPDTWDSDTWDSLNRVLDEAAKHRPLAIAALGCCLCRLDIWWAFMLARDASWVSELPVSMHQSIDIGELAAYIVLIFVSTRTSTLHAHGMLLVSPVVIAFASLIGLSVSPHASAFRLLAPCSFFGLGFSSIVCLMLWCEFLGTLRPRDSLAAFTAAELLRNVLWFAFDEISIALGNICCIINMVISTFLLVMAYRSMPTRCSPLNLPNPRELPARPLLWCAAFAFAYGLGDSSTGIALTSLAHTLGMMAALMAVMLALKRLGPAFSLDLLRQATFALMTIGLLLALTVPSSSRLAQGLMSAANEAQLLFTVTSSCLFARTRGTSAVIYCCLLRMCTLVFANVGSTLGRLAASQNGQTEYLLVIALALIVLATTTAFRSTDTFAQDIARFASPSKDGPGYVKEPGTAAEPSLEGIVDKYHLTGKEAEVLAMLVKGMQSTDISESLFIAPSTVRVHVTNIYRKLGVHSRAELNAFIARLV